jgi:two-component system sensor histidine kinase/response regulator
LKPKTLHRTWPIATFEAVYQLLQRVAELPGAIWLASESIAFVENMGESPSERFAAVVSEQFSALLRASHYMSWEQTHKNPAPTFTTLN